MSRELGRRSRDIPPPSRRSPELVVAKQRMLVEVGEVSASFDGSYITKRVERSPNAWTIDVPLMKQRTNWCGYTGIAMMFQRWGKDVMPEDVYEAVNEAPAPPKDAKDPKGSPAIKSLLYAAEQMAPDMTVILADVNGYKELQATNPELTPHRVLQAYIRKQRPCLARFPGHFVVVKGYDRDAKTYTFNDSLLGEKGDEVTLKAHDFDDSWRLPDEYESSADGRYLLATMYPQRKENP